MASTTRRDQALTFLYRRIDYERIQAVPYGEHEFRLERMRDLLARLGNPQDRLQIVHVAGTKGKGSTSAMLAAVLSAAGYRTGLYTSPHLDRLEERFIIDGQPCSGEELAALVDQIRPVVEQMDAEAKRHSPAELMATYFEITTAMALLHFAQSKTDAVVLEVGLGGRLDSTNVCQPLVSVIISISFDHMKQLGNTLGKIAAEKAGIIKPGIPVVSGVGEAEPRQVISQIARERGCRLLQAGLDFTFTYFPIRGIDIDSESNSNNQNRYSTIDYQNRATGLNLQHLEIGLLGQHQAANASVALATLDELKSRGWDIPEAAIRRGLREVRWPARVEVVSHHPTVVIDGAHNTASVESLVATLNESFSPRKRILVFATTQDKDVRGMLQILLPQFETVVLTEYLSNPRVMRVAEIDAIAAELSTTPRTIYLNPTSAWEAVCEFATPEHLICITGSFFLAAEIRQEIARRAIRKPANNRRDLPIGEVQNVAEPLNQIG